MLEYTNKYWKMFVPMIKKSLVKRFGKDEAARLLEKTDGIYRDMLNRANDIGKDNPMASNMYECLIFLALRKAADGKISIEELREITHEMLSAPTFKAMGLIINANKPSGIKRIGNMMKKNAQWLDENPKYKEFSWECLLSESSIRVRAL